VRRISGSGFTSVPTPSAQEFGTLDPKAMLERRERCKETAQNGNGFGLTLSNAAILATVPTPMAGSPATDTYNAAGNSDYSRRIVNLASVRSPTMRDHHPSKFDPDRADCQIQLSHQAQLSAVPTPCTPNGGRSISTEAMDATGRTTDGRKHTASLEHTVKFSAVATPRSEDSQCAGSHRGTPDTLHSQANLAAVTTPSARDWKDTSGMSESGVDPDGSTRSRLDQLPRQAQLAASGATATGGTAETASTGQLDPAYSRCLQGLPPEFCDCAVMAMQSLRKRRKPLSKRTSKRGKASEE
jgi:hypothetical protein